jgi:STE24 endopeptidase
MNRSTRTFKTYLMFLAAATAALGVYFWFAYRKALPSSMLGTAADPLTFMTESEAAHAASYSMIRDLLFFVGYFWEWGILLWLLTGGFSRTFSQRLKSRIASIPVRFAVYIAGFSLMLFALGLPFRLLTYAVSKKYGISALSFSGWMRDQWVHLAVDFILLLAVSAVVFALLRRGGTWWFRLWLLAIPFVIFMMYIRPVVIDPLFNRYDPLSDVNLQQSIIAMTTEAGIPIERVYEANYSEKTNAINAYVDGFGPSLRIVIWDTALAKLTEPEILVMTAHEIAHYVKKHLEWSAAGSVVSAFFVLWFGNTLYISVLKKWRAFLYVRNPADWAGLPLLLLIVSVLTFMSTPFASAVSRSAEREADLYAYALTGQPAAAVTLYQKLATASRSVVHPPALTYWFRYTHPSLGERIVEASSYARSTP